MRGRGLLCREAPSLALPSEETSLGGDSGGEAASLREAPLPQTPSPEEWLGIGLCFPSDLCAHASWGRFPVIWLRSRRLTEPPRPANVYLRFQFRQYRTNELVRWRMHFLSDAIAEIEGLLEVNRDFCKKQMAEKASPALPTNCAVLPLYVGARRGGGGDRKAARRAPSTASCPEDTKQ